MKPNKLTGTGPKGSVCLLFADYCGIGDDIAALPVVAKLAESYAVTVYTPHPDLWRGINVKIISVKVTGVEAGYGRFAKSFYCENGEYLDMLWDANNLPKYETIYKLTAWGCEEDNEFSGARRSRFEQLAELLDTDYIRDFDYARALNAKKNPVLGSYILMSVESHEAMRTLSDEQARELYDGLNQRSRVVWLSEEPGSNRKHCATHAELIELVYNATEVIGTDNGVMHIACALGKRSTIIGGMTDVRSIFEPYNAPLKAMQTTHDECISPCYRLPQNGFLNNKCCGSHDEPQCLRSVSGDAIISVMDFQESLLTI